MTIVEEMQFLVIPKIRPSSGPLFFTRSLEKAVGNVTANGSFGLVDTGEKSFWSHALMFWMVFVSKLLLPDV